MTHFKRVVLIVCLVLFPIMAFCGEWSVGPERFFKDGKEVSPGTPGAVSGDELARQNLPDHKKIYRDSFCTNGSAAADRGPEEIELPDHKKHDKKEIIIIGTGFLPHGDHRLDRRRGLHQRPNSGINNRSSFHGKHRGRR